MQKLTLQDTLNYFKVCSFPCLAVTPWDVSVTRKKTQCEKISLLINRNDYIRGNNGRK